VDMKLNSNTFSTGAKQLIGLGLYDCRQQAQHDNFFRLPSSTAAYFVQNRPFIRLLSALRWKQSGNY